MHRWISKILSAVFILTMATPSMVFAMGEFFVQKQLEFERKWNEVLSIRGNQKASDFRDFPILRKAEKELQVIGQEVAAAERELLSRPQNTWSEAERRAHYEMSRKILIYDHYSNLPKETKYNNKIYMNSNSKIERNYVEFIDKLKNAEINKSRMQLDYDNQTRSIANRVQGSGSVGVVQMTKAESASLKSLEKNSRTASSQAWKLRDEIKKSRTPKEIYDPLTLDRLQKSSAEFVAHFEQPAYQGQAQKMISDITNGRVLNGPTGKLLSNKLPAVMRHQQIQNQRKNIKVGNKSLSPEKTRNLTNKFLGAGFFSILLGGVITVSVLK